MREHHSNNRTETHGAVRSGDVNNSDAGLAVLRPEHVDLPFDRANDNERPEPKPLAPNGEMLGCPEDEGEATCGSHTSR